MHRGKEGLSKGNKFWKKIDVKLESPEGWGTCSDQKPFIMERRGESYISSDICLKNFMLRPWRSCQ